MTIETAIRRFADQMQIEMDNNSHKSNMMEWHDFEEMITELEYHKAKMFMALRAKNYNAMKEYIADCANLLLAIGNMHNLYQSESVNNGVCHELNRLDMISEILVSNCSKNQSLR